MKQEKLYGHVCRVYVQTIISINKAISVNYGKHLRYIYNWPAKFIGALKTIRLSSHGDSKFFQQSVRISVNSYSSTQ